MNILVKVLYFFLILWILLVLYKLYDGEMYIRIQHKTLQENRLLLLEASDYYLWKHAKTINNDTAVNVISSISSFVYKNTSIYVGLKPQGNFCIYRVVYYNAIKQLFFCLE